MALIPRSDETKNLLSYYLNFVVVALVGIVINPIMLMIMGPSSFGTWKALQRYLDFASVADGRATQALKWLVANRTALSPDEKRRDLGAAVRVWLFWLPALVGIAVLITIAVPLLVADIPDDLLRSVYWASAILASNLALAGLLSIPDSVLVGVNKGYQSMVVTTAIVVISNAGMVLVLMHGGGLAGLAIVVLIASVVNAVVTWLVARSSVPWWGFARPERADVARVTTFSAWTLAWSLVEKVLLSSELILVGLTVGVVGVAQLTFTTFVGQFVLSIALITASGYMPRVGALYGTGARRRATGMTRDIRHTVLGISVVGFASVIMFNGWFVSLWAGEDQYLGWLVNVGLAVAMLLTAMIRLDGQVLDAVLKMPAKVLVVGLSTVIGIVGGVAFFYWTGSLVVSLAFLIASRTLANFLLPVLIGKFFAGAGYPARAMVLAAALLALSISLSWVAQAPGWLQAVAIGSWFVLTLAAVVGGLVPRRLITAFLMTLRSRRGRGSDSTPD
ncbi:hypothetical protein V2V91_02635 [Microbacterium schleiferi]|uniref:Lipopolysaccharide biosynthesis protein n=1 Tax=Microbacterium schleiferi TaxID=69362 RepID=A0ABU7V437_9MICO